MPWDEAAEILHDAMENIMEGELDEDDDEELDFGNVDMAQVAQNMQQAMQQAMQGGGMQEYLAKVQVLQMQMMQGQISMEEYTSKVQELAAGLNQ